MAAASPPPDITPPPRARRSPLGDRWLAYGALALALGLAAGFVIVAWRVERAVAGSWGFPLDDSWIHAQIARNLSRGLGWTYNAGVPVQNSSGPLWTALVALGYALFGPGVWVPKVMGGLCFAGCVALGWQLARALGAGAAAAALAAVLLALSAPLAWHGLSGMETPLAALLVLATLNAFLRHRTGRRRFLWAVWAALAVMARPETLILLPILAADRWQEERRTAREAADGGGRDSRALAPDVASGARLATRDAVMAVGLATLCLLPYFALNLSVSGTLFPTTFGAKAGATGLGNGLRAVDLREVLASITLYPYAWAAHTAAFASRANVALWLLLPVGVWALARPLHRGRVVGLVLVLLPLLRGAMAPHQTPGIQQGRYVGSVYPLLLVCGAVGLVAFARGEADFLRTRRARGAAIAGIALVALAWLRLELRVPQVGAGVAGALPALWPGGNPDIGLDPLLQAERLGLVALLVAGLVFLAAGFVPGRALRVPGLLLIVLVLGLQLAQAVRLPRLYARNVRNIQEMDVELGRWIKSQVPEGTRIAVNDIGALAYFGERPLVDAIGLATPELTPYLTPKRLRTLIGMRRLRPPLCILFPAWFPEWTSRPSLLEPVFRHRIEGNTVLGSSIAVVYRADWDRFARYYPDALLEKLDPPAAYASLAGHWRRGLRNLGMAPRSALFTKAGDALRAQGELDGALRMHRKAVAIDREDETAWQGLAQATLARGDLAAYGTLLQEMTAALPTSASALEALGDWQASRQRVSEAGQSYDMALALHPDNLRLLSKAESFWANRGDPARAAGYAARRRELEPAKLAP